MVTAPGSKRGHAASPDGKVAEHTPNSGPVASPASQVDDNGVTSPKLINPFLLSVSNARETGGTLSFWRYKVSDGQLKSISRKFDIFNDTHSEHTASFPVLYNASSLREEQPLTVCKDEVKSWVFNLKDGDKSDGGGKPEEEGGGKQEEEAGDESEVDVD